MGSLMATSSPQVGDVLTTPEQLDACPTGTIIRKKNWVVARRHDGEWAMTGERAPLSSDEMIYQFGEVTVIWVPAPTRAEITINAWQIDSQLVSFPHTRELIDLLYSVPVTGRVRVTVERIGDDDE